MAPILLDSRDLLKLALVSVLVMTLVFVAGFFLGHQRAATFYQAGSEVQLLPLPEKITVAENILESQQPEVIEAGEDIDVDQPETVAQNSKPDLADKKSTLQLQTLPLADSADGSSHVNKKPAEPPADTFVSSTFTSAQSGKIKYSVQVGMYGRLLNAENMMKMLQAQQYDAYVSDYTNKKNETRYNVRFGYFVDKKSAIAKLKEFKAAQKGDGYLVKFSAGNIVNVAGASHLEQANDTPLQKNKTDKAKIKAPATIPLDAIEETSPTDISQADILNTRLVTTN